MLEEFEDIRSRKFRRRRKCVDCEYPPVSRFSTLDNRCFDACSVHGYDFVTEGARVIATYDEVQTNDMYQALEIDGRPLIWVN